MSSAWCAYMRVFIRGAPFPACDIEGLWDHDPKPPSNDFCGFEIRPPYPAAGSPSVPAGRPRGRGDAEQNLVHFGRGREDVTAAQPGPVVTLPVGHDPACLPDDDPSGRDVPRAQRQLEVAVEHALGGPAEVEAGGPGAPQVLERAERGGERRLVDAEQLLVPEGEARRDDRLRGCPARDAP